MTVFLHKYFRHDWPSSRNTFVCVWVCKNRDTRFLLVL